MEELFRIWKNCGHGERDQTYDNESSTKFHATIHKKIMERQRTSRILKIYQFFEKNVPLRIIHTGIISKTLQDREKKTMPMDSKWPN